MKIWHITLIAVLVAMALAGCGGSEVPPAPTETRDSEVNTSAALDASYENALPVSSQLALGIFQLEETEDAVTSEQASALLPLWQAIQAGTLQGETETNAVLKQIEREMTSEQLEAIAAMQLTWQDMTGWAEAQGLSMGLSPEVLATRQAQGDFGPAGNLSEEERAVVRATVEGGGMPFGGNRGNLGEEEREARRATAETSGMDFGNRGFGGRGQLPILAQPLIELLTQRAAE